MLGRGLPPWPSEGGAPRDTCSSSLSTSIRTSPVRACRCRRPDRDPPGAFGSATHRTSRPPRELLDGHRVDGRSRARRRSRRPLLGRQRRLGARGGRLVAGPVRHCADARPRAVQPGPVREARGRPRAASRDLSRRRRPRRAGGWGACDRERRRAADRRARMPPTSAAGAGGVRLARCAERSLGARHRAAVLHARVPAAARSLVGRVLVAHPWPPFRAATPSRRRRDPVHRRPHRRSAADREGGGAPAGRAGQRVPRPLRRPQDGARTRAHGRAARSGAACRPHPAPSEPRRARSAGRRLRQRDLAGRAGTPRPRAWTPCSISRRGWT